MAYVKSGVEISGLNDTLAGFKAMGAQKEFSKINLEVGKRIVPEAEALVPVRTGDLRGSIRAVRSLNGVIVKAGNNTEIPYANPINWGWFYDRKRFIHKNIKPTQFMNKGAAKVIPWIKENYIKKLVEAYERVAGK
jgi:hypothetical protein